jgi:hypothetical protein
MSLIAIIVIPIAYVAHIALFVRRSEYDRLMDRNQELLTRNDNLVTAQLVAEAELGRIREQLAAN